MIQFTPIIVFKINQKVFFGLKNVVLIGRFENVLDRKFTKSSAYGKIILNGHHRGWPLAWKLINDSVINSSFGVTHES